MGATYHQFCPVAKAMELLDERWTLLVMRELVLGTERFNDLRRGVPRMSPSLLSHRLQRLVRAGVVERIEDEDGVRYVPTEAGRELRPVIEALGAWGTRSILSSATTTSNRTCCSGTCTATSRWTPPRTGARSWRSASTTSRCGTGGSSSTTTSTSATRTLGTRSRPPCSGRLRELIRVHRGDSDWRSALRSGALRIEGTERVRRDLPHWFRPPQFAQVPHRDRFCLKD